MALHGLAPCAPRDTVDTARLARGEKARFAIAVAALGVLLLATIPFIPFIPSGRGAGSPDDQTARFEGVQFAWVLDAGRLVAGEPVTFDVRARDVNHGFAIYNNDDVMPCQVQAIPDHPSEVSDTFKKPRADQVVCL